MKYDSNKFLKAGISRLLENLPFSRTFEDPPPPLFIAGGICLALAIFTLQNSHATDQYRHRIMGIGVVIGIAAASQSGDPFMSLKSYLAWSAIIASVMSILFHRIRNLWADPDARKSEREKLPEAAG